MTTQAPQQQPGGEKPPAAKFYGSSTGRMDAQEAVPPPELTPEPKAVPGATSAPETPSAEEGQISMPQKAFNARLEQARRAASAEATAAARAAVLKELGVEDPAKFRATQEQSAQELKRLKEAEEKRKRASMSEEARLRTDLESERKQTAELRQQLEALESKQVTTQMHQVVREAMSPHVDPDFAEDVEERFRRHILQELPAQHPDQKDLDEALNAIDKRYVEKWTKKLIERVPKFAKPAPEAPKAEATQQKPPAVVRKPLTNGAPPPRRPEAKSAPAASSDKTFKPGQKNSMSRDEANAEMKRRGLSVRFNSNS